MIHWVRDKIVLQITQSQGLILITEFKQQQQRYNGNEPSSSSSSTSRRVGMQARDPNNTHTRKNLHIRLCSPTNGGQYNDVLANDTCMVDILWKELTT